MDSSKAPNTAAQDGLYADVQSQYAAALERLARGYEPDPDRRRDLLQEIHVALWRSLASYDRRCSLRTWIYRVAHNVATSKVLRRRGRSVSVLSLDDVDEPADSGNHHEQLNRKLSLERLMGLINTLEVTDRQVILLYLEGLDGAEVAEISGMSAANVATKIHRLKKLLARRFHESAHD